MLTERKSFTMDGIENQKFEIFILSYAFKICFSVWTPFERKRTEVFRLAT